MPDVKRFSYTQEGCPDRVIAHGILKVQCYGWCIKCGYLYKERFKEVKAPKIKWLAKPAYQLKNLTRDFIIADFERRPSSSHINNMVSSMLQNEFYDTILRVVEQEGKYIVIDAQHRVQALEILHAKYGVEEYDLMLAVYPTSFARKIYRQLNVGKPLVTADHLVALDNGKVEWFKRLKPWCAHYRQAKKIGYLDVLFGITYAKRGVAKARGRDLDKLMEIIKPEDIAFLEMFCSEMLGAEPMIQTNPMYRMPLFRNIMRVSYESKLTREDLALLIKACKHYLPQFPQEGYASTVLVYKYYEIIKDKLLLSIKK